MNGPNDEPEEEEEEDDDDIFDEDEDEDEDEELDEDEDEEDDNENCLKGLRCPKCRSTEPLVIAASMMATLLDDGVDETEGCDWEYNSSCRCKECGFEGVVLDFEEEDDKGPMRTFVVELCRTAHRHATVRVQAASSQEAKKLALAQAGDLSYSLEKDAEYAINYVSEPAESV